ncbi:MAG TPA: RDD family protein [Verrucomicrobiae bacterium]|nr:RDD family protein [Verrucomicrobiae bacterium]
MSGFCQKCGASLSTTTLAPSAPVPPPMRAPVAPTPAISPYAGFWIRLLATIIDRIILGVVFVPVYIVSVLPALARAANRGMDDGPPFEVLAAMPVVWIAALVLPWLYEALLTSSSWQGTVGKKLLGMKVTDIAGNRISFGRATARFFAKILSFLICYIGVVMVAFTDRKRGLHDMIADTLVYKS